MTSNQARLTLLAGVVLLASVVMLVIVSRSGEYGVLTGPWNRWLAHPRPATVDEQREFMRLSLDEVLGLPPNAGTSAESGVATGVAAASDTAAKNHEVAASKTNSKAAAHAYRLALLLTPNRLCDPLPYTRGCEPDAGGRLLIAKKPPPEAQSIEQLPIALRSALVRTKPAAERLPDPGLPEIVSYETGEKMVPEKQRLIEALFRGEIHGGLGYTSFSWAVVSADGKTALMDVMLTSHMKHHGFKAIEVFAHDGTAWRRTDSLRY